MPAPHRSASTSCAAHIGERLQERVPRGMREPPRDQYVLVGERDRGAAVQLADEIVEHEPRLPTAADGAEPPQDAGRAADALERAEQKAVQLVVRGGEGHEREPLDVLVEGVVLERQTDRAEELTELVELRRLQRERIPGLRTHGRIILAYGRGTPPVELTPRSRALVRG